MEDYILVIGGVNVDIAGIPKNKLISKDSNPGSVEISFGGVGRNIAENLARLNQKVKMITLFGDDGNGRELRRHSESLGIDFTHSEIIEGSATSTYLFVLNEERDMEIAISSMDIYSYLTPSFLEKKREVIEGANHVVVDTNIPEETLEYLTTNFKVPIFVDCVSTMKAKRISSFLGRFYGVKANKLEAEAIVGFTINNLDDLARATSLMLQSGVQEVYVTLGENGVFYNSKNEAFIVPAYKASVVNSTGAGDALMAGLSYAFKKGFEPRIRCMIGAAASKIAIESMSTISKLMSLEEIERTIKECDFKDVTMEEK